MIEVFFYRVGMTSNNNDEPELTHPSFSKIMEAVMRSNVSKVVSWGVHDDILSGVER